MATPESYHILPRIFSDTSAPSLVPNHSLGKDDAISKPSGPGHLSQKPLPVDSLTQLLASAASSDAGIVTYTLNAGVTECSRTSYRQLLDTAKEKAQLIHHIDGIDASSILLLHFDSHSDNIVWFWAATLAGYLPAISTPLANDLVQRKSHLSHLHVLLNDPIVLTKTHLLADFLDDCKLRLQPVEKLPLWTIPGHLSLPAYDSNRIDDLAVLMLTSGSTGNAKAVGLRHRQILTAISGKSAYLGVQQDDTFLNWIGMDHVAGFTEMHLQAMYLCAEQVHVQATEVLADPIKFLRLLGTHKVGFTFAPNFFLALLRDTIAASPDIPELDLSHLRVFTSGGEANVVDTCACLTEQLRRHGVKDDIIRPGFGMTETCAGSVFSRSCPSYDITKRLEFASLGSCVPGIKMRVVNEKGTEAAPGEIGSLQLSGPIVFKEYFNNPDATEAAFSKDDWFITGDKAFLDAQSNLNLAGRSKDTIIINGVKFSAHEIESAIEEEKIAGVAPSFTVVFPHRPLHSETERTCILYSPEYDKEDTKARFDATNAIAKIVGLSTGSKPSTILPLPKSCLEKTSLGKVPRMKIKTAFEEGEYRAYDDENNQQLSEQRALAWRGPNSKTESSTVNIFGKLLGIQSSSIDIHSSIFELGITSFNLIAVMQQIQAELVLEWDLSLGVLLKNPTIQGISSAIDAELLKPRVYDPVVPLQTQGNKTPLWCVHPGSGDILVFIQLAQQFADRPVYALRTRGYNPGEGFFSGPHEAADTYCKHIKITQKHGPYAIAGYSLGSTIGFEIAKRLQAQGDEVRFLASIDFPPFASVLVAHLNWTDFLLHTALFLDLIDEKTVIEITYDLHRKSREEALDYILEIGDQERLAALACNKAKLALISDIEEAFGKGGADYEPTKGVKQLDVFVADPPYNAAKSREDWMVNHLGRWRELSDTEPVFHECLGKHTNMLNKEYVQGFTRRLKASMRRRGV